MVKADIKPSKSDIFSEFIPARDLKKFVLYVIFIS